MQEQEFFGSRDREISESPHKAARAKLIEQLAEANPTLLREFRNALHDAEAQSQFVRKGDRFPLGGRGDVNTYVLFAELGRALLGSAGHAGMIVPSGIATDDTTKYLFRDFVDQRSLVSLYDIRNQDRFFYDVGHRRFKFSLLTLALRSHGTDPEFAFGLEDLEELLEPGRRVRLSSTDFALFNPNTRTCPTFRSSQDAKITRGIYERVPVLIDESDEENGNPWGIRFMAMFHMSNDSGLFHDSPGPNLVPLYEAKLVHHFDHRYGDYAMRAPDSRDSEMPRVPVEPMNNLHYQITTRYWVPESEVAERLEGRWAHKWLLGFRSIARSTDVRTVIACVVPHSAVSGKLPLLLPERTDLVHLLLGQLNSFAFDYVARQKVGGTDLAYHYVKQFPAFTPTFYSRHPCTWLGPEGIAKYVEERVLELTYTAWNLQPFAADCGYDGPPFRWDPERRFLLRCELDAAFFHLYGLPRDDVDYIMDTFPIVRRKDEAEHGEYQTKRVILEIYDEMAEAIRSGHSYQTHLDPPSADPRVAHPATAITT